MSTTPFDATPRFEYEELKQIQGQHVRVLNEQRRHTQLIGDSAKQRLKQRLKERIQTEEVRAVSRNLVPTDGLSQRGVHCRPVRWCRYQYSASPLIAPAPHLRCRVLCA